MSFIRGRVIYHRGKVKVYINQCYSSKKKSKTFAVRKDDYWSRATYLGSIEFKGGVWRQYVFCPENSTIWSANYLRGIIQFCEEQNLILKEKRSKRRK